MSIAWKKIKKEINDLGSAIVAVSGGVDSVFLLDFVSKCNIKYAVAYFDHDLGNGDTAFVKSLADNLNVPFYTARGHDIAKAASIEAEARIQRYAFLNSLLSEGYNKILTAHHHDDQVLTVLMRLIQGHQHNELGMKRYYENIFRPFLNVPKEIIIKQAKYFNLKWIEDESNNDIAFERNWLKLEILPKLMERRNVMKTITRGLRIL